MRAIAYAGEFNERNPSKTKNSSFECRHCATREHTANEEGECVEMGWRKTIIRFDRFLPLLLWPGMEKNALTSSSRAIVPDSKSISLPFTIVGRIYAYTRCTYAFVRYNVPVLLLRSSSRDNRSNLSSVETSGRADRTLESDRIAIPRVPSDSRERTLVNTRWRSNSERLSSSLSSFLMYRGQICRAKNKIKRGEARFYLHKDKCFGLSTWGLERKRGRDRGSRKVICGG